MEKCTYCVQMVERAKIRHKSRLMKEHPGQPSTSIHVTAQDMLLSGQGRLKRPASSHARWEPSPSAMCWTPPQPFSAPSPCRATRISSPAWARLPARATWFRQETPIRPWRNKMPCPEIDKNGPSLKIRPPSSGGGLTSQRSFDKLVTQSSTICSTVVIVSTTSMLAASAKSFTALSKAGVISLSF